MLQTAHKNCVPDEVAALLTAATLRVLCGLLHYRNRKTGLCCPRMDTIAAYLHLSHATIQRHVTRLEKLRVIQVLRGRYSNHYSFAPVDEWASLIRSNGDALKQPRIHRSCRPIAGEPEGEMIQPRTHNSYIHCRKNDTLTPRASLYEPSVFNLEKLTTTAAAVLSVLAATLKQVSQLTKSEAEPASPVAAAAVPIPAPAIQENTPKQPPIKTRPEPPDRQNIPHRHTTPPIASPEAVLKKLDPDLAECAGQAFEALMHQYPSPGLPMKGLETLIQMLRDSGDPWKLAKRLVDSGEGWKFHWYRHGREFKPQLWRWLTSGDWQYTPVESRR